MMDSNSPGITQSLSAYVLETVSSETLSFLTSAGAADGGQAAGVIVYGKLAKGPIMNKIGDRVGEYNPASSLSSSLVFTTGVLDSALQVGFCYVGNLDQRLSVTAIEVNKGANGTWALDYQTGLIVVKKKSNATTQAITSYIVAALDIAATSGSVDLTAVGGVALALGQALMAASIPVTLASNQTPLVSGTATTSSVSSSATNVTLLAANANRKNASFYNSSTEILYLKLGATASATDFTVRILPEGYYEVPIGPVYSGKVDGIWANANGSCKITELT